MFKRVNRLAMLTVLLAVGLCWAQEQPGEEKSQEESQKPRQPPTAPPPDARQMAMAGPLGIFDKELNLDESQQTAFQRIMEEHRNRERDIRMSFRPPPELAEKMAEIRKQMQAAREAGDNAKVQAGVEELRKIQQEREVLLKPINEQIEKNQQRLHDDLLAVMRDDQKEGFEDLWLEHFDRHMARLGLLRNPRVLKTEVERLSDLTPDQKKQIDGLFKEHRKAVRRTAQEQKENKGHSGMEMSPADQTLVNKLQEDVLAVLTPEQRAKIEPRLRSFGGPEHERKLMERTGQGERPHRPMPPGGAAQPVGEKGGEQPEKSEQKGEQQPAEQPGS